MSSAHAAAEIDRVLAACVNTARPVYLTLPTDLVYTKIPSGRLTNNPLALTAPENDKDTEEEVLSEIVSLVEKAEGSVVLLVDACAVRHHVIEETREFAKKTGFPVYSTPMGKGAVNEDYERYGGVSACCDRVGSEMTDYMR
jgi:pyruvate decarboxylase